MRKLKFKLDRKPLETIYLVFIRPLLEYGDVIWDNKNELDKIKNLNWYYKIRVLRQSI